MGEGDRLESLGWYQEMLMGKVGLRRLAWRTGAMDQWQGTSIEQRCGGREQRETGQEGDWELVCSVPRKIRHLALARKGQSR